MYGHKDLNLAGNSPVACKKLGCIVIMDIKVEGLINCYTYHLDIGGKTED